MKRKTKLALGVMLLVGGTSFVNMESAIGTAANVANVLVLMGIMAGALAGSVSTLFDSKREPVSTIPLNTQQNPPALTFSPIVDPRLENDVAPVCTTTESPDAESRQRIKP